MKKFVRLHCFLTAMMLMISLLVIPSFLNAQDKGTFTDSRDGRVYTWIKAGNQTWMAENLKFAAKADCWTYNNDSAYLPFFGRLYSWKAAQTVCPKGWHLPSDKEWGVLFQTLGGTGEAGLKIQSWDTVAKIKNTSTAPEAKTSSSVFGGVRHPDGSCIGIDLWGGFWSSNKTSETESNNVLFVHGAKALGSSTNDGMAGFSVRCIKNK